jgi:hypothetical protein
VIEPARRRILHFNVTRHPSADWVVQQLREAFPEAAPSLCDTGPRFDSTLNLVRFPEGNRAEAEKKGGAGSIGKTEPREDGSEVRREVLDYVIALNERNLRRLIAHYILYHERGRIHDSLDKDTPHRQPIVPKPAIRAGVISLPRLGGCCIGMCGVRQHRTRPSPAAQFVDQVLRGSNPCGAISAIGATSLALRS